MVFFYLHRNRQSMSSTLRKLLILSQKKSMLFKYLYWMTSRWSQYMYIVIRYLHLQEHILLVWGFWFRSIREFFTHMEMMPLPGKSCKCLPILSTYVHLAVTFLKSPSPDLLWHSDAKRSAVELSLPVLTTKFVAAEIRTPNLRHARRTTKHC